MKMATANETKIEAEAQAAAAIAAADKVAADKVAAADKAFADKVAAGQAADKENLGSTVRVRSKVGNMCNPFTGTRFEGAESKKVIRDAWIDAQIKGDKLEETAD
jgi:membrane protein involved in colicin uptake